MGFVFKTIRKEVGEVSEEVCYHFEVFEDFMAFEKQDKSEVKINMGKSPPWKAPQIPEVPRYDTLSEESVKGVTEIIKGEKYRIKGNDISNHDFSIGDVVEAKEYSGVNGQAFFSTNETEGWYVHFSEVEKTD